MKMNTQTQDMQADDNLIENYTENLNQKARIGKIDPLIGREEELERVIQVLCRRRKNNPLLIGNFKSDLGILTAGFGPVH